MRFYHYTKARNLIRILRDGLKPKGAVFLFDSYNLALDNSGVLLGSKPVKVAILEVNIPKSWAEVDDGYRNGMDVAYGHSFKVRRRIIPRRLKLKEIVRWG